MAYSLDFRRRVLAIRERDGLTYEETSARFGVGIATLTRWNKHIERRPYVRRKGLKIDLHALKQDVLDYPDAYQYERAKRFGVCPKAIWKALKKLGVTYKKSASPPQGRRRQTSCLPKAD